LVKKLKRGHPPGPRMKCGWGCDASLPGASCARTSRYAQTGWMPPTKRTGEGKPERAADPRPRMLCGWRCGARLTAMEWHGNAEP
jgi:hypothetical protein